MLAVHLALLLSAGLDRCTGRAAARVHPGESNASWMMLGLLDFLTGPSAQAVVLRRKYVFKVWPATAQLDASTEVAQQSLVPCNCRHLIVFALACVPVFLFLAVFTAHNY